MSRVLVVTAVDVEARALARHLGLTARPGRDLLDYRGRDVDVACVGPRALHLSRLADLARGASLVVAAGTCGALAPDLGAGALVVPEAVVTPAGERYVLPARPGLAQAGRLLTVDHVVETAEAKARLRRESAALAVDMESAVVVAWARALALPAIAVRAVSDGADRGVSPLLAGVVDDTGRTRVGRAMRIVLTRRGMLAEALALRRSTSAALRNVAGALRIVTAPGLPGTRGEREGHGTEAWSSPPTGSVRRARGPA